MKRNYLIDLGLMLQASLPSSTCKLIAVKASNLPLYLYICRVRSIENLTADLYSSCIQRLTQLMEMTFCGWKNL